MTTSRGRDTARPLPKRTLERLAVCEAVGLHYWAQHPARGFLWAVDDQQRAHIVKINPPTRLEADELTDPPTTSDTSNEKGSPVSSKNNETPSPGEEFDPFDPEYHVETPAEKIEYQRVISTIKVRTPGGKQWFRVHPGFRTSRQVVLVNTGDDDAATYVVTPGVVPMLPETDVKTVRLYYCIYRDGTPFLWRVPDTADADYLAGVLMAIETGKTAWVKTQWIKANGSYDVLTAEWDDEPVWPSLTDRQVLEIAFRGRVVSDPEDDFVYQINGRKRPR